VNWLCVEHGDSVGQVGGWFDRRQPDEAGTMTASVAFDRIFDGFEPSRGAFYIIFGGLFELYIDKRKTPGICKDIRPMIGPYLKLCWPSRYIREEAGALEYFCFSDYPVDEQKELLRATERYLADFSAGRLDPKLRYLPERKSHLIASLANFVELMKRELAVR
jgi:hypothetical protein